MKYVLIAILILICIILFFVFKNNQKKAAVTSGIQQNKQQEQNTMSQEPKLYIRHNNKLIEAPEEDNMLVRNYSSFKNKGVMKNKRRLTIISKKEKYKPNETIRIVHILESANEKDLLYIMGPKKILDEYVNNILKTDSSTGEYPWIGTRYRGKTISAPAIDHNYEVTTYSFSEPGEHTIQWKLGDLESNILKITVSEK